MPRIPAPSLLSVSKALLQDRHGAKVFA